MTGEGAFFTWYAHHNRANDATDDDEKDAVWVGEDLEQPGSKLDKEEGGVGSVSEFLSQVMPRGECVAYRGMIGSDYLLCSSCR
jgi:hypothetical protein